MLLLYVVCGSAVILVGGFFIWRQWFETYHLATVDEGKLYRDGNRGMREYRNMLRRVRPRTIVSLIDDTELNDRQKRHLAEEMELLAGRSDVGVERLPVRLGGWPDARTIERFLRITTDPARQPVLVHCAQGVRRTGMMAAAYQLTILNWPKEQAKQEIRTFGHSMRTVGDVQRFIDVYDPGTRQMTEALPMSQE